MFSDANIAHITIFISYAILMCLILNKILVIFHIHEEALQVLTPIFSQGKEQIYSKSI